MNISFLENLLIMYRDVTDFYVRFLSRNSVKFID